MLGALAPLGLGAAAGTALVVDLDPAGPHYPGAGSLANLVADGPRRSDLSPDRAGLAVLRNGGIDAAEADEVLTALEAGWPSVVVRLPAGSTRRPDLVVRPLVPGGLFPIGDTGVTVFQDLGFRLPAPARDCRSCPGGPPPPCWREAFRPAAGGFEPGSRPGRAHGRERPDRRSAHRSRRPA